MQRESLRFCASSESKARAAFPEFCGDFVAECISIRGAILSTRCKIGKRLAR
jgi:hypothetical protein